MCSGYHSCAGPWVDKETLAILNAIRRLPHLLTPSVDRFRPSELAYIRIEPANVWRDINQGCVALPHQMVGAHEQLPNTAHSWVGQSLEQSAVELAEAERLRYLVVGEIKVQSTPFSDRVIPRKLALILDTTCE